MGQKEKLLDLLSDRRWHGMEELNEICYRYVARFYDLGKVGYEIEKKNKGNYWLYRLKKSPDDKVLENLPEGKQFMLTF